MDFMLGMFWKSKVYFYLGEVSFGLILFGVFFIGYIRICVIVFQYYRKMFSDNFRYNILEGFLVIESYVKIGYFYKG